jgi:hypothetical protein
MVRTIRCNFCGFDFLASAGACPHCGRPALFPNVTAAEDTEERAALQKRYDAALSEGASRGASNALLEFEKALAQCRVVISRPLGEVQRLASSDKQLYATYYQLLSAGVRLPSGSKWDILRALADEALFPGYKENIRFGALTLDHQGVSNYGECHLILCDDMTRHRATLFEENSTMWMKHHDVKMAEADNLPRGYRSTWDDRVKLGSAKLASKIMSTTPTDEFSSILMRQSSSSDADEFIEVHVCGPLTIRSFASATLPLGATRAKRVICRAVVADLAKASVNVAIS